MEKSAVISRCEKYRYALRRTWDGTKPRVLFVGLNPSTADGVEDDPTLSRCIGYAKRWDYGGVLIGNLFALRSTDPSGLYKTDEPVGTENDHWLEALQSEAKLVVCAWGSMGGYMRRDEEVLQFLKEPHCLVTLRDGRAGHPLYKPADLTPIRYRS